MKKRVLATIEYSTITPVVKEEALQGKKNAQMLWFTDEILEFVEAVQAPIFKKDLRQYESQVTLEFLDVIGCILVFDLDRTLACKHVNKMLKKYSVTPPKPDAEWCMYWNLTQVERGREPRMVRDLMRLWSEFS